MDKIGQEKDRKKKREKFNAPLLFFFNLQRLKGLFNWFFNILWSIVLNITN